LLSGGTFLGQAILIVISPVLTRMFTPAEFGVLAVFTALTSMMIVAMALRYEFAIPVCRDDDDALAMLVLCAVVTTGITLLLTVLILGYGQQIAAIFGLHGHEDLLWLAPPSLWLWGLSLPLANWTIRRSAFRLNAGSNLAQFATQAMAQLSLGALGGGGSALVIGYSLGPVARLALLRNALGARDRARLTKLTPSRVWRMAREHWRYPVFSSSSSVLQSASQMLPAVLVAALYGPAAAGLRPGCSARRRAKCSWARLPGQKVLSCCGCFGARCWCSSPPVPLVRHRWCSPDPLCSRWCSARAGARPVSWFNTWCRSTSPASS
jgi:O-antigen/teichoic acid export membrane protein